MAYIAFGDYRMENISTFLMMYLLRKLPAAPLVLMAVQIALCGGIYLLILRFLNSTSGMPNKTIPAAKRAGIRS